MKPFPSLRQPLVLGEDGGEVGLGKGVGQLGVGHHRLHRDLVEAAAVQVQHVLGKVQVVLGEGAPDIVLPIPPALHQLLELGQEGVVAAGAVHPVAHPVVDLPAPVHREHHVVHLPVDEVDALVGKEGAVGGDGEAEVLAGLLLPLPGVADDLLHHPEIHQRLPAREVQFQVPAALRFLNEEVDGLLPHLQGHLHPVAGAKVPGAGETVVAPQVAVVGDVQTHGLDGRKHHPVGELAVVVGGKQRPLAVQFQHLPVCLLHGVAAVGGKLVQQFPGAVLRQGGLHRLGHLVKQLVHHMDTAAVDI